MYTVTVKHYDVYQKFEIGSYKKKSDAIHRMRQEATILEMNGLILWNVSDAEVIMIDRKRDIHSTRFAVVKI